MASSSAEDRVWVRLSDQLLAPWALYRNASWLEKRPGDEPADGEADLVVGHPELGIMVMEVKGGGVRRLGASDRWESTDRKGVIHEIKDPFRQVTREMYALRRVAEELPDWPVARVRFARAVVLPDVTYPRVVVPDGPPEIVIDRGDLGALATRVREIFDWWSRTGDAADYGAPGPIGMRALDLLLARNIEIPSPLATRLAQDEAQIIRLSEAQLGLLDFLGLQRRALVLGVAGSGKTLLAAEKAQRLAAQGFRVLLTCFNRPLAEHLAVAIGQLPGLDVSTFHGLAEDWGQQAGIIDPKPVRNAGYFDALPDALDRAIHLLPEPRYDAIVVDEAQDIDAEWWLPLLDLLADPERGIVYVFGDANQDLYHSREPMEMGVVMPERPPAYVLHENRRTTQAIHEFASRFSTSATTETALPMAVGPVGDPVEVVTYPDADADACRAAVGRVLDRLLDVGGVAAADVTVLTPRSVRSSWLIREDRAAVLVGRCRLLPEMLEDGRVAPPPAGRRDVRVATIHRFKGLESPVVVLTEIDGRVEPQELDQLLYVGATRARTHLVVVAGASVLSRLAPRAVEPS